MSPAARTKPECKRFINPNSDYFYFHPKFVSFQDVLWLPHVLVFVIIVIPRDECPVCIAKSNVQTALLLNSKINKLKISC